MAKKIAYRRWKDRISEITPADHRIGTDLLLIDDAAKSMYVPNGAFRSDAITILLFEAGSARMRINMRECEIKAPCVLMITKDSIYESLDNSPDVRSRAIIMSGEFLGSLAPELGLEHRAYQEPGASPVIQTDDIAKVFCQYYDLLLSIVKAPDLKFSLKAAKHLTLSMFYGYTAQKVCGIEKTTAKTRQEELFTRFMDTLRKYCKSERSVSFYAEQLCVTPKYLSRVVSEVSGHTVSYYIDDYVTTEIKAMLCSTSMPIEQISCELGFPSQSVLGKYFKRITGMSPRDYRRNVNGD